MRINSKDKKKYVLKDKEDYKILEKIYNLEKYKLSKKDKELVNLARTQLEKEWRKPLMKFLDKLIKNYN